MKEKISVLIADDNQDFAYTLSNYINDQEDMEIEAVNLISTIKTRNSFIRCNNATFRWIRCIRKIK